MGRTWISVRVELVEGHGEALWPRPGRLFVASRAHTFEQLATSIDAAFARWDLAHLHEFELAGRVRVGPHDRDDEDPPQLDSLTAKLGRLALGEAFTYVFDLGDMWTHLCTVGPARVDPLEVLGIVPDGPLPYWGWGAIPDQYLRGWDGDNGEDEGPGPDPRLSDLPALRYGWGWQAPDPAS